VIPAAALVDALKQRGLTFVSGVPDSTLKSVFELVVKDPAIRYVPAVREDVALGVASAAYFAGGLGCVLLQNSGLGNVVNGLTSFSLVYGIPCLLMVGWRGYGGPPQDAPEHWVMGVKTLGLLELLDLPYQILEPGDPGPPLDRLLASIGERSVPGALIVRPGVVE
jgi:phosphonopyruvate decarboxylase